MHVIATRETILAAVAPLLTIAQRGMKASQNVLSVRSLQNGTLQFTCSDDNAVMTTTAAAESVGSVAFAAAAKRFHEVFRSLPSGSKVEIKADDANLLIAHGGSRFKLNTASIPEPLSRAGNVGDSSGEFSIGSDEFGYLLGVAQHAVHESMNPNIPSGILLHMTGDRLRLIGTNGGRMAVSSAAVSSPEAKIVLSSNAVADIKSLITKSPDGDVLKFSWKDGVISVSCAGAVYQAGITFSTPLDYERVLNNTKIVTFHVGLDNVRSIVSRMLIVSSAITLRLSGRTMTVATEIGEGKKKGEECSESFEIPEDAKQVDEFQVTVNGRFLMDALGAVRGEPVHLSYVSGGPLVILASGGEARVYVMPLRV